MKRAGIYIRVSTQEQAEEGYSIQAQKERLINYCKAKDWHIADIYIDGGFSGSNLDRPSMQKLVEDVNAKKLNIVLVYKLDRLSRSQKDTLYLIEDVFLSNNVDFVSMNESFDTSTPFGRAMVGILSVFAQLEREQIKERTLTGRHERAKEGLFHGGNYAPIGYDYIDGQLIINDYEALQVREIYDMYLSGQGVDAIQKIMHDKGYTHKSGNWRFSSSVQSALDSPVYAGLIVFKDKIYEGQHEAIIPRETFEKVQSMRQQKRADIVKPFTYASLLGGLVICGVCGGKYFMRRNERGGKVYDYYCCYSRSKSHPRLVKDPDCDNKNWRVRDLDAYVEQELFKLALDVDKLKELNGSKPDKPNNKNVQIIEKKISGIDAQISKLMDLYQLDSIPLAEVGRRIEELHNNRKSLQGQLEAANIPDTSSNSFNIEWISSMLFTLKDVWPYATLEEKRNIIRSIIKKITIEGKEAHIDWVMTF